MAEFFKLTNQQTEDKLVSRVTRIYADDMIWNKDTAAQTVNTRSRADLLKAKFYADAIKVRTFDEDYDPITNPDAYTEAYFRIGRYYEMEHLEEAQLFNSAGFFNFSYECTKVSEGNFTWRLIPAAKTINEFDLYVSNVNFDCSFYRPERGWLSPDNPDNIIDLIEEEVNPGLPLGAELNDFLVEGIDGPEWKNGPEMTPFLAHGNDDAIDPLLDVYGIVKGDQRTTNVNNGVVSLPIDDNTIYVDADPSSGTYGKLMALGGGGGSGINYSEIEQGTGLTWIDGKPVFQITIVGQTGVVLSGVDTLIRVWGARYSTIGIGRYYNAPMYANTTLYANVFRDTVGDITCQDVGFNVALSYYTLHYTKL